MLHSNHGRGLVASALLLSLVACAAPTALTPHASPAPSEAPGTPLAPVESALAPEGVSRGQGPGAAAATPPAIVVAPHAPSATAAPSSPRHEPAPFSLDLYRAGDFVVQYTNNWCVGASLQMMRNLMRPGATSSRAEQASFWRLAQARSASRFGGANPRGWTAALNELGLGPYELVGIADYGDALRAAASALRATGRPVGLVMWAGRHAWVMSGFTSLGDPRTDRDFVITGVRVLDPLYPQGTTKWGPSPRPDSLLRPSRLDDAFVPRRAHRFPDYVPAGTYALVLPVGAAAAVDRSSARRPLEI